MRQRRPYLMTGWALEPNLFPSIPWIGSSVFQFPLPQIEVIKTTPNYRVVVVAAKHISYPHLLRTHNELVNYNELITCAYELSILLIVDTQHVSCQYYSFQCSHFTDNKTEFQEGYKTS